MLTSFSSYRPQAYPAQQRQNIAPQGALKFGACVNAATTRAQFQERLLTEDLRARLHAIASAGKVATADFSEVLSELLLKDKAFNNDFQAKRAGDKLYEFTLMALVESALKNPTLKDGVLETLEKAKKSKHLRKQYALIEEALKKLQGHGHAPSQRYQQVETEYKKEQAPHSH
jgi:hypothetical protein